MKFVMIAGTTLFCLTRKRARAIDVAVVLLVAALGVALALQGWRSRVPSEDVIPYIDGAHALLSHGWIPERGVVTSFASFAPPGLAWVVLPGVSLFSDPRVFDVPGNAILHLGTLVGIFLLARACCGARCALLSVLLYGVSELGLTFAGSFGPRGHPFFYVWMAYWTCWWVALKDARYLAAALVTWLAGMYVFMEMAPAVISLPLVWVVYRPPVGRRALALAGALGLLMWSPYLRFEATRGFADIRSQVLLQSIAPATYRDALCDPTLTLRRWAASSAEPVAVGNPQPPSHQTRVLLRMGLRALAIASGLVGNFGFEGPMAGTGLALFAMTVAGMLVAVNVRQRRAPPDERDTRERVGVSGRWAMTALAIGLLVSSGLANEVVNGRLLGPAVRLTVLALRTLQALAALGGLTLLMRRSIARSLGALASRVPSAPCDPSVLVTFLAVPWAVLLLVAEWGRYDRLVGLWPLQVIVLAFFWSTLLARSGRGARLVWAGLLLIISVIVVNPFLLSRLEGWRHDGWSGADAVEVRLADHLAGRLRAEGRNRAAVGYRLFVEGPPQPLPPAIDDRSRIGKEFDVILEFRHGIANLDTCGEGLAPQDEYRIVDAYPPTPDGTYYYFDVPSAGRLRFLEQIGSYQMYKRD